MFEYDQDIVQELLIADERFQRLYQQHCDLKIQVREAKTHVPPLDDLSINKLKRRKLLAKDKMAHMIQRHQLEHA
jgi:uncharacterized protein YdcH (DUF465 family)